jgi:hypothetical protein
MGQILIWEIDFKLAFLILNLRDKLLLFYRIYIGKILLFSIKNGTLSRTGEGLVYRDPHSLIFRVPLRKVPVLSKKKIKLPKQPIFNNPKRNIFL